MEPEEETKPCGNCKREIPCSNLTMHELHCTRNITACPTCKEPVPRAQMQEHMDSLHKLVPCKQCGESVCGTDLEDHIRDSCANTIKACRFCELELPRRSQPAHESYCGARTEQCVECGEYVMLKYRQLHLDSNHGFLRLDDDPEPRKEIKPTKTSAVATAKPSSTKLMQNSGPKTTIRNYNDTEPSSSSSNNNNGPSGSGVKAQTASNGAISKTVNKNGVKSSKKRPAPAPPRSPPPLETRDLPYYSAAARAQREEQLRQEQTARNLAMGLPPVLNPAEKLEKLRKMDAFANREIEPVDYRDKLRGQVWMPPDIPIGQVLGNARISQERDNNTQNNETKRDNNRANLPIGQVPGSSRMPLDRDSTQNKETKRDKPTGQAQGSSRMAQERDRHVTIREHNRITPAAQVQDSRIPQDENANSQNQDRNRDQRPRSPKGKSGKKINHTANGFHPDDEREEYERRGREFKNLKPMTPQEFVDRFNEMQMRNSEPVVNVGERSNDRFSEIKSSLRELRRGLNEVTAPYNANANSGNVQNNQPVNIPEPNPALDFLLPCEFCTELIAPDDLVIHQTGCRPDLAQLRPSPDPAPRARSPPPAPAAPTYYDEPVIPCEFCMKSLPVYLITEHQERCGREANLLYPD